MDGKMKKLRKHPFKDKMEELHIIKYCIFFLRNTVGEIPTV
jgi:hypothetical protein